MKFQGGTDIDLNCKIRRLVCHILAPKSQRMLISPDITDEESEVADPADEVGEDFFGDGFVDKAVFAGHSGCCMLKQVIKTGI